MSFIEEETNELLEAVEESKEVDEVKTHQKV